MHMMFPHNIVSKTAREMNTRVCIFGEDTRESPVRVISYYPESGVLAMLAKVRSAVRGWYAHAEICIRNHVGSVWVCLRYIG